VSPVTRGCFSFRAWSVILEGYPRCGDFGPSQISQWFFSSKNGSPVLALRGGQTPVRESVIEQEFSPQGEGRSQMAWIFARDIVV
jgi:hypothetical protein